MKKSILNFEKKNSTVKIKNLKAIIGGTNGKGTKRTASSGRGKPQLL